MANREACEVYIEQEIETGLEEGKTPYSIGKELSDWVAKLFEVSIKPTALEKRAERKRKEFPTNVGKKSNNQRDNEEIEENQRKELTLEIETQTERGGKREGAGRKPESDKIESSSPKKYRNKQTVNDEESGSCYPQYSQAMHFADIAINQLGRIEPDDPKREEGLKKVSNWVENSLNQ